MWTNLLNITKKFSYLNVKSYTHKKVYHKSVIEFLL